MAVRIMAYRPQAGSPLDPGYRNGRWPAPMPPKRAKAPCKGLRMAERLPPHAFLVAVVIAIVAIGLLISQVVGIFVP